LSRLPASLFFYITKIKIQIMPAVADDYKVADRGIRETKEVRIMRIPQGGSHLPSEVLDNANMRLSSVYVHQRPYRGLTQEAEKELLPEILGISADDNNFSDRARRYWAEMTIDVPQEGHMLSVPILPDDADMPHPKSPHVEDWIKYKFAQGHPQVAESRSDAEANVNKSFFIYDPEKEAERENRKSKLRQKAYMELAKASENEAKLDVLVRVLTDQRPERLSKSQKENILDTQLNSDPEKFVSAATDSDLALRGLLMDAIENEVLNKIGNQIMYQDETIADTMDEAIAWAKNDRNSGVMQEIKAKLKEAKR